MYNFFVLFILISIATEAIADILVNAEILSFSRKFLFNIKGTFIGKFFYDLFDCVYCMTVWVSFILLLCSLKLFGIEHFILFILIWFSIHKVAMFIHNIYGYFVEI